MTIMFISNRNEINNHYTGPSINASYKIMLYWTKWFQRRRFLEFWKSTNQKQEFPMAAMLVNRSERNDQT
jgi:hypothetical protein